MYMYIISSVTFVIKAEEKIFLKNSFFILMAISKSLEK